MVMHTQAAAQSAVPTKTHSAGFQGFTGDSVTTRRCESAAHEEGSGAGPSPGSSGAVAALEWLASSWVSLFWWWEVIWSVLDASEERIAHVCPWRCWILGTVLSHCISSLFRNRPCTMPARRRNCGIFFASLKKVRTSSSGLRISALRDLVKGSADSNLVPVMAKRTVSLLYAFRKKFFLNSMLCIFLLSSMSIGFSCMKHISLASCSSLRRMLALILLYGCGSLSKSTRVAREHVSQSGFEHRGIMGLHASRIAFFSKCGSLGLRPRIRRYLT